MPSGLGAREGPQLTKCVFLTLAKRPFDHAYCDMTIAEMLTKGWTMQALASALDVDPSTVYRWRERSEPRLVKLALAQLAVTEAPVAYRHGGPMLTYLIQAGDAVKIGRARNVQSRLATLQTGSATTLHLLGITTEPEEWLHTRFAEHRLRGEWFRACPAILSFADSLATSIPSVTSVS